MIAVVVIDKMRIDDPVGAIVKPSKVKSIQTGLREADIPCFTVIPVKGTGLQKSYAERYRGTENNLILQTRVMTICIISDENLEKCVDVILDNSDGNVGDGKIFVYNVEDAIRISTQVRGGEAIR